MKTKELKVIKNEVFAKEGRITEPAYFYNCVFIRQSVRAKGCFFQNCHLVESGVASKSILAGCEIGSECSIGSDSIISSCDVGHRVIFYENCKFYEKRRGTLHYGSGCWFGKGCTFYFFPLFLLRIADTCYFEPFPPDDSFGMELLSKEMTKRHLKLMGDDYRKAFSIRERKKKYCPTLRSFYIPEDGFYPSEKIVVDVLSSNKTEPEYSDKELVELIAKAMRLKIAKRRVSPPFQRQRAIFEKGVTR